MKDEQQAPKVRTPRTRKCPVCRHESWPMAYGDMMPDERALMPKTEFPGCCLEMVVRSNPRTGEPEMGIAKWECQNPECRHRWWQAEGK